MTNASGTLGGHELPSLFGTTAPPPVRAPRRKSVRALLVALAVLVIAAVCGVLQLFANLGYDDALTGFEDAAAVAERRQDDLTRDLDSLAEITQAGTAIVDADSGNLLDAASRDALVGAIEEAQATATDAESDAARDLPEAGEKPFWAWELFGTTTQLVEQSAALDDRASEFRRTQKEVGSTTAAVEEAGIAAMEAAAAATADFEAAHVSARNLDVIALRRAAEDLAYYATALDDTAALAYTDLEAAAAQVLASEQAELSEKAGPLQNARLEVEAFARGLAPGVLLDFDWAPTVNGFGYDGGMGGYATWWYDDPGYATIELSNSVAEQWPSERSQALVAHEVGHAISVKCEGMYDDSNQDSIEAWATAWAISMGFHNDANGTWAYGAPPQSLIDIAAGCR